jgi:starch synthase (maltosyl-transferring)
LTPIGDAVGRDSEAESPSTEPVGRKLRAGSEIELHRMPGAVERRRHIVCNFWPAFRITNRRTSQTTKAGMSVLPKSRPSRVVIEGISPEIDAGKFPAKTTLGEGVTIGADIICDGHEVLDAIVRYRTVGNDAWRTTSMKPVVNDRWEAEFTVETLGLYEFQVEAWIDRFATWRRDLEKKSAAGQDVRSELLEGVTMVREAAERAAALANTEPKESADRAARDADRLRETADLLEQDLEPAERVRAALEPGPATLVARYADRSNGSLYERTPQIWVDRPRARFGAWYEMFPRSTADEPRHGTLADIERRLPYVAEMGFDVLYLPPIHPIGRAFRKGPNNTLEAGDEDPGSPWAIGADEGGHKSIHPALGTFEDFDRLLAAAKQHDIEIAMDIAFQCSPDHPYVREHPEWFRKRPDGTIKYAENPPKKYQDIYPLDFECAAWRELWDELLSVVMFWAERGVRIFRVDNPHTKPFRFWEWLIGEVRRRFPDSIFLSEAFTRPKIMKYLAKSGFTQSYTYFTWRNTKPQIESYFNELTQTDVRHYLRPNLFANTPDILPEYLQYGGPASFQIRLVLAATLGATYGIYGPVFERFEARPVKPHSEEYLDSEKYQIRRWDWNAPNVFCEFIGRINRIRRENEALHFDDRLRFYPCDNPQIVFYGKSTADLSNVILTVVNVDPHHLQTGWVEVPLEALGIGEDESYQVHDLITDARFLWHGRRNYVHLDPQTTSSHILRLRKRVKTERDFDYFL